MNTTSVQLHLGVCVTDVGLRMNVFALLHLERHIAIVCSVFCLTALCPGNIQGCDPGWSAVGDYCFILLPSQSVAYEDVVEAWAACKTVGSDMATIRNEDEQNLVTTLFYSLGSIAPGITVYLQQGTTVFEAYIAMSDTANEGTFLFFDGTTPNYTNWKSKEPNDYQPFGGENCVSVLYNDRFKGVWLDVPCLYNPRAINGTLCKKLATEPEEESTPRFFHEKYHMVKASYMVNSTIQLISAPTYADCMRHCSNELSCLSVNYNRKAAAGYNCVLNGQSRLISRNLTADDAVAGFDLDDWIYYEQRFKGH